jgi:predicted nucleotide-binding protein
MARINSDLLNAIIAKTGSKRTAYRRIEAVQNETFLERDIAALVVGAQLRISINRYSTPEQRAQVRGLIGAGTGSSQAQPPAAAATTMPRVRSGKRAKPKKTDNSVFVISGRDAAATESMYQLLDALGCRPVEFHQAVARMKVGNPFIGDVLDKAFETVQGLVVLFTPDDEAKLKDQLLNKHGDAAEKKLTGQPRANVIFEAGMALARHPDKTLMVQVGPMKSFSDISGRHLVRLDDSFESRQDFAARLSNICKVDTSGTRWTKVGSFVPSSPAAAKRKKRR